VNNLRSVAQIRLYNEIHWPPTCCSRYRLISLPVMELPRRKGPNEDSQRRAARRKYNVQLEQSNLDTFLQQRGIDVPRTKRSRLEPVPNPGPVVNGTCATPSHAGDIFVGHHNSMGGSDHGAQPNESDTLQVRKLLFCTRIS
jgi:hypothetical protein